jgi:hypothetical protein
LQVGPQTLTNDDIAICSVLAQSYLSLQFQALGNGSVVDLSPMCRPKLSGVVTPGGICNAMFQALNLTFGTNVSTETSAPFNNEFCLTQNNMINNGNYLLKRQQSFLAYLAPYDMDHYDCVSGGPTVAVPKPSFLASADSGPIAAGAYPVPVTSLNIVAILNSGSIKTCKLVPKKTFLLQVVLGTVIPSLCICVSVRAYRKAQEAKEAREFSPLGGPAVSQKQPLVDHPTSGATRELASV